MRSVFRRRDEALHLTWAHLKASSSDTELILLDTQLHRQELPITMHQHPSTPSHRDAVVSAWEACGRFVDWRASVSREITEEGLEGETQPSSI